MRLQSALDEVIDLLALGAGKAEAAAGGHKLAPLDQRETLSMLPGDSIHPKCALSRLLSFQDHLVSETPPPFRIIFSFRYRCRGQKTC